jgi:branched-chain amino acid transport system permease protein
VNRTTARILAAIAVLVAVTLPAFAGDYPLQVARNIMMYMALAVTWDMLLRSGQISFGISGLFGIGAYAGILGMVRGSMPAWLALPFAALFAGLVAFLIGLVILRLRGTYFSIVTMALGEIFRIIIHNLNEFTGGPEGIVIPQGVIFGGKSSGLYWLTFGGLAIALGASYWFDKSRFRFALTAIRNNEVSAKSSGIDIFRWLLVTFVITSAIQGLMGGIFVLSYGFASPDSVFSADFLLLPMAMALLGGIHSTVGPILGGLLLGIVAEWLNLKLPYGHLVVYGVMVVVVILFMPQGLLGFARKAGRKSDRRAA